MVAIVLLALGGLGHAELGMRAYPVAVNAIIREHHVEHIGEELREAMGAMQPIETV